MKSLRLISLLLSLLSTLVVIVHSKQTSTISEQCTSTSLRNRREYCFEHSKIKCDSSLKYYTKLCSIDFLRPINVTCHKVDISNYDDKKKLTDYGYMNMYSISENKMNRKIEKEIVEMMERYYTNFISNELERESQDVSNNNNSNEPGDSDSDSSDTINSEIKKIDIEYGSNIYNGIVIGTMLSLETSLWECVEEDEFYADVTLVCPKNHSICFDDMDECWIEYDPLYSVILITLMILAIVACPVTIICIIITTHCCFLTGTDKLSTLERGVGNYRWKRSDKKY